MTKIASYDHLFRASMADLRVARDFFDQHLPEKLRQAVDLQSLKLCPQTYIDEKLKLTQSDVLYETIREHHWAGVLTFFLKHAWKRDFLPKLQAIVDVLHLLEAKDGAKFLVSLLEYALIKTEKSDEENFVSIIKQGLSAETGEKLMTTVAEHYIAQGKLEGFNLGISQGISQGEHNVLLRLLKRKFSHIPHYYLEKMACASEEALMIWSERVLFANSLEEVFAASGK